jgi:hypothetical protein
MEVGGQDRDLMMEVGDQGRGLIVEVSGQDRGLNMPLMSTLNMALKN